MPVFFAFYWVLLESVEMRQAPFMFWIQDLSSRDPLRAAGDHGGRDVRAVQAEPDAAGPDPGQGVHDPAVRDEHHLRLLPAGLVLYWVTNTLLTILQQWNINRRIEAEAKKARTG
jgi:YidC/Oxa1 family membrane protein insertase